MSKTEYERFYFSDESEEAIIVSDALDKPYERGVTYPSLEDERFNSSVRWRPRTIFLLPGLKLMPSEYIPELIYDYSDRINQNHDHEVLQSAESAAEEIAGSKNVPLYHQEFLKILYDQPNLSIAHVLCGIQSGNGYPYLIFGHTNRPPAPVHSQS